MYTQHQNCNKNHYRTRNSQSMFTVGLLTLIIITYQSPREGGGKGGALSVMKLSAEWNEVQEFIKQTMPFLVVDQSEGTCSAP